MNIPTPALVAAAAVAIWAIVAVVAGIFIGLCVAIMNDDDDDEIEIPSDAKWLDDQPAEVLVTAALRARFNKTLIENGIEDF